VKMASGWSEITRGRGSVFVKRPRECAGKRTRGVAACALSVCAVDGARARGKSENHEYEARDPPKTIGGPAGGAGCSSVENARQELSEPISCEKRLETEKARAYALLLDGREASSVTYIYISLSSTFPIAKSIELSRSPRRRQMRASACGNSIILDHPEGEFHCQLALGDPREAGSCSVLVGSRLCHRRLAHQASLVESVMQRRRASRASP
jgi:hypothetical protein